MSRIKQSTFKFLILAFCLFLSHSSISQNSKSDRLFEKALNQFHQQKYKSAIHNAKKVIAIDSGFIEAYILVGNIYEEQQNTKEALYYYDFVFSKISTKFIGSCIHAVELKIARNLWKSAIDNCFNLLNYELLEADEIKRINYLRDLAEFRLNAFDNPIEFIPKNLGEGVNTEADEYINTFYDSNQSLLFTRKKTVENNSSANLHAEQLFGAELKDNLWQELLVPEIPKAQNYRLGASTVSSDGRYLIFTACYHPDGFGNCDLYYIDLWADTLRMQNMGSKINSEAWESQANFSADGQSLYFASKRKGGYGGSDLWVCKLDKRGYWSDAINLGPQINTKEDEMAPFMHPDGHSFYFSSKGHLGMGGFDLFKSEFSTSFSAPQNLGYPLNTKSDEINLIVNNTGSTAYLSTVRAEGYGGIDIYEFELEESYRAESMKVLNGKVIDAHSKNALSAYIQLNKIGNSKAIAYAISNKENGQFKILIPDTILSLNISKAEYLFYSVNISNNIIYNDTLLVSMQKIKLGAISRLENVFFYTDRYNLKKASFIELDKIVDFLNNNPGLIVEIGGHTDDTGTSEYNLTLSNKRAKAVVDYLITNGISISRIQSRGYGFLKPILPNNSKENRAANRRTEIKIIGL